VWSNFAVACLRRRVPSGIAVLPVVQIVPGPAACLLRALREFRICAPAPAFSQPAWPASWMPTGCSFDRRIGASCCSEHSAHWCTLERVNVRYPGQVLGAQVDGLVYICQRVGPGTDFRQACISVSIDQGCVEAGLARHWRRRPALPVIVAYDQRSGVWH